MVEYATRADLRAIASKLSLHEQQDIRRRAESRSPKGSTFLSHSSKDDELVTGAIRVLENHGATVYIDKIDPELPPYTNKETANKLKQRINETNKFVLLASKNSRESKWVPWELGIADGYKNIMNITLFPAVDEINDTAWTSSEYLGLYDRIVWGKLEGYEGNVWMVLDQKAYRGVQLSEWLRR